MVSGLFVWLLVPAHRVRLLFNHLKKPSFPSEHELKTLASIAEIIYPEDSTHGAQSLGIANYFITQFRETYYKKSISIMQRLVLCLDKESQKNNKTDFISSENDFQNKLINLIVTGNMENYYPGVQKDFNNLVDITLEGCFSDQVHGGNKNREAWKLMKESFKVEWFDV